MQYDAMPLVRLINENLKREREANAKKPAEPVPQDAAQGRPEPR